MTPTLAWLAPVLVPLVGALLVRLPGRAWPWLLPLAPLPAGALALAGAPGPPPELGWVLLDARLLLDPVGRALLAMTALLWAAAGLAAQARAVERRGFAVLWLLTLAGNVGLLLAGDVATFYTLFALMTFAAYGLVVDDRSAEALRAGRGYVVLAVLGESALLAGFLLAVGEAGGALDLTVVRGAVADSAQRDLVIGLLLAGFAVKAGVVPLHGWLPLAHPAAPVPASAVLSGAMLKAGLLGWLRLVPLEEATLPGWSATLVTVGLLSAFAGVAIGLTQREAKVVLAYSSVSQMGFVALLVGVAASGPEASAAGVAAAVAYAVHHGLAKGALFLGVGMVGDRGGRWRRRLVVAGLALPALALAGLPLSSGALAKVWAKDALALAPGGWPEPVTTALSLAAVGTTLLMARLAWVLRGTPAKSEPSAGRDVAWAVVLAAVAGATWALPSVLGPAVALPAPSLDLLVDALWPVALGAAIAGLAWRLAGRTATTVPEVPAGDVVVAAESALRRLTAWWRGRGAPALGRLVALADRSRRRAAGLLAAGGAVERVDLRLTRWRTAGALFGLVAAALLATLLLPAG